MLLGLSQALSTHANTDKNLENFLSLSLEELVNLETTIAAHEKHTTTKAPAVVTLITADDIKATGATNLTDVLEGVPGIHIKTHHFGFRPLIYFRGASAKQTLLMVNGTPMKDLMWGFGIFWKGLPTSMIERIEIIRGPGSALFGSDASAGVINVITKTAGKIQDSEIGVRAGSFNTKTAWMQHGDNWNGFDIGLTAELFSTDGHAPLIKADAQTISDQANGTSVSYAPGYVYNGWNNQDIRFSIAKDNWRVLADFMRHTNLETGLTGAGTLDPVTQANDHRYNLDLLYNNESFSDNWGIDAELSILHLDYSSGDGFQERPPGYTDSTGTYPDGQINQMRSAERRGNVEISGLYRGIENHALRIGAGYIWQDLYSVEHFVNFGTGADGNPITPGAPLQNIAHSPYAFAPEKMRKIGYLFLQNVWTINNDLELTAGARYDDYSDFGDTLNPRLALVWNSTDKLTTKLMYGRAFRAPSYLELFAETSWSLPNENLDPERSETLELAFSFDASKDLLLNLNLYHFKQTDIIRATDTGLSKLEFQNLGDHSIHGAELEVRWQATKDLGISGNYSLRKQDDTPYREIQEPEKDAYLRIDWGFLPEWNWNLQTNWISERLRASGDTRAPLDDYYITDTTIRYAHSKSLELAASVRNLFDDDTRECTGQSIPDDLPLPERNIYAEMRYKF
ncbi:MAG: TonB-dependent receptor [Gammaproteobacteria bacterium]|nr:TonB-dependent receptor [Gammaproteobacteria bacterium]